VPSASRKEGLISRVLMILRSCLGQTRSKYASDTARGAGSPSSQGPPAEGPEIRALRGVRGAHSR
jgi:hypothetical protein